MAKKETKKTAAKTTLKKTVKKNTAKKPAAKTVAPQKQSKKKAVNKISAKNVKAVKATKTVLSDGEKRLMIAEQAYYKWQSAGYPNGQDHQHWLEAEREIAVR